MVGVASPLFRNGHPRDGRLVVAGYVTGTLLAALVVLTTLQVAAAGLHAIIPGRTLSFALALILGLLFLTDLLGRTLHWRRQTPQRVRRLPPFVRGAIWGTDIGLLFSTVKVTSLVWALLALCLVQPRAGLIALGVYYTCHLAFQGGALHLDVAHNTKVFTALQKPSLPRVARSASVVLLGSLIYVSVANLAVTA